MIKVSFSARWLGFFLFIFGFVSISSTSISLFPLFVMKWVSILKLLCGLWGLSCLTLLFWNKIDLAMLEYWCCICVIWSLIMMSRSGQVLVFIIYLFPSIGSRSYVEVVDRNVVIYNHAHMSFSFFTMTRENYINLGNKVEMMHYGFWLVQVGLLGLFDYFRRHKWFLNFLTRYREEQEQFWLWLMEAVQWLVPLNQTHEPMYPIEDARNIGNWYDHDMMVSIASFLIIGVIKDFFISVSEALQSKLDYFLCEY